jgi:hypothetical protein
MKHIDKTVLKVLQRKRFSKKTAKTINLFFHSSGWSGIHSGFKRSGLQRGQLRGRGRIPSLHLSHQEGTHS